MGLRMKALFDSDILIDYLQGFEKAKQEIERYSEKCISLVSWMEVMVGAETNQEIQVCRQFLGSFILCPITLEIANRAVILRKKYRLKLPDAILLATAYQENCLFVTRNIKDFSFSDPHLRIPYKR
jgi:hypothetical protein